MLSLTQWRQSPVFDMFNPGQMIQEHYTGLPGGYSSYYFDRVPTDATLMGLGDDDGSMRSIVWGGLILGVLGGSYYAWNRRKRRRRR